VTNRRNLPFSQPRLTLSVLGSQQLAFAMFVNACNQIRETIYGLVGVSQVGLTINASSGTGFMIAPGILATAAHLCHVDGDVAKARQQSFEAIRSPDIGQRLETAAFVAEDTQTDIALLRLAAPRSTACVKLETNRVPTGTACGSLGFPPWQRCCFLRPAGRSTFVNVFNLLAYRLMA
jgi:hypothetical protein